MGMYRAEIGSDVAYGLALIGLNRVGVAEDAYLESIERLLSSIDGHPDARLVLQTAIDPAPATPYQGRTAVHLFVLGPPERADLLEELVDDLVDLLATPPHPWSFEPISDEAAISQALSPFPVEHFAEIARREAPCPAPGHLPPVGYLSETASPEQDRLWSLWRFDAEDRTDAGLVLLSQDHPIIIRTVITGTELTGSERALLEDLVDATAVETPLRGIRAASGRVFERMLIGRPLYETAVLVASPSPIGASVLSAIGWSISPPQDGGTDGVLRGGFEALRETAGAKGAWDTLSLDGTAESDAASNRERIRRILTMGEAATAFGLPTPTPIGTPGLRSFRTPVVAPPISDLPTDGVLLGRAFVGSDHHPVRLATHDRMRHLYLTGQTGTGKSTMMGNLILDDIERGAGVAVVDPHGSLVQSILERIPEERIDDVIVIEPADAEAVVGVNLLEAESEIQRTFIVSELAAMFYALFDPGHEGIVGPRYETWLRQGAQLLLSNADRPSSLLDIPTAFTDRAVQRLLVDSVDDVVLLEFWKGEVQQTSDYHRSEVLGWFRSKFEVFRTSTPVRRIVGQAESTISFEDVLADGRILLVNLSKGYLGGYNANLIGYVVLTRLWQATLGRGRLPKEQRPEFFVYIDEFQNLTTSSLDEMLSEARKFDVGVTLANQFLGQIPKHLQQAIIGNVSTKLAFRLGPEDAALFDSWMGPSIDAGDLTHLRNFTAIAALSNHGEPIDPLVVNTLPLRGDPDPDRAERIRARSRELWAVPIDDVDRMFRDRWADVEGSFAYRIANPDESSDSKSGGVSSFLDDWLEKRKGERPERGEIETDGSEEAVSDVESQVEETETDGAAQ